MLKRFEAWLLDRGDLAIFCVNMTIPILWVIFVFVVIGTLRSAFDISDRLSFSIFNLLLLSPILLYGMYNILRYVYETTVSKS